MHRRSDNSSREGDDASAFRNSPPLVGGVGGGGKTSNTGLFTGTKIMKDIRKRIEIWFGSVARTLYHHRLKTLLIMVVWIVALVSQLPKITIDTSTEGFLHEDDQTLIDYNAFRDQFGRDEMIIIAIKPPDVFDPVFLEKLRSLHEELEENVPYMDDITSLINARNTRGEEDELIVEDLLEEWPETPEAVAHVKQRALENPMYVNTMISEDATFTTIVIKTQ